MGYTHYLGYEIVLLCTGVSIITHGFVQCMLLLWWESRGLLEEIDLRIVLSLTK
jgi:hypothetical protein